MVAVKRDERVKGNRRNEREDECRRGEKTMDRAGEDGERG